MTGPGRVVLCNIFMGIMCNHGYVHVHVICIELQTQYNKLCPLAILTHWPDNDACTCILGIHVTWYMYMTISIIAVIVI